MSSVELGKLIFTALEKNIDQYQGRDLYHKLFTLFNFVIDKFLENEKIHFTTLFSKIAFVGNKHRLSRLLLFHIHGFRKSIEDADDTFSGASIHQAMFVIAELTKTLCNISIPEKLHHRFKDQIKDIEDELELQHFKSFAEGVIVGVDIKKSYFIFVDQNAPQDMKRIAFNVPGLNDDFNNTISFIIKSKKYPVNINLLDIEINKQGIYVPKSFVFEPDYLVDVTSIAETFSMSGVYPRFSILKKFLPFHNTPPLMLGNLANHFLDLLISNPEIDFNGLKKKIFRLNPLGFSLFNDVTIQELISKARFHFQNLKKTIKENIIGKGIDHKDLFLEPSFYSRKYGIQGRLDLFHVRKDGRFADIIELKSGKPFRPNAYGLNINHYTQTLLYDLLIKSVYSGKLNPSNYILYSSQDDNALRFAPSVKVQQREALKVRNELIILEKVLEDVNLNRKLFDSIKKQSFRNVAGFNLRDIELFNKVFSNLSALEKNYFCHFAAFTAKEHHLAKTGEYNIEKRAGLASMWNLITKEKESQFNIISYLKIESNQTSQDEPIIVFQKSEYSPRLTNFRVGDIGVVYPFNKGQRSVLKNQIFKCTVVAMEREVIKVRLRNKQFNQSIFELKSYWHLEHDLLDSSFNKMYQGLFSFASSEKDRRDLLLTLRPPKKQNVHSLDAPEHLTSEQKQIFKESINAIEYYLIWGPPGTGKTSVMLKSLVEHFLNNTSENLLLLAYTNRAVDEMCAAINNISENAAEAYLRIGSRYSCGEAFKERLFDHLTADIDSRKGLKELLDTHPIVISTVASISGKQEVLKLKQFDRIIIDEASQILEPYLIGLLSQNPRFILIGDHKQLPAVVVQNEESSNVELDELNSIGLHDMRDSLFERLFRECEKNNWDWAIGRLSKQGRMHSDLMSFPNEQFYGGELETIPGIDRLYKPMMLNNEDGQSTILSSHRLIFIPAMIDEEGKTNKTNAFEAAIVKKVILQLKKHRNDIGKTDTEYSIGVITPFRAQISKIRDELGDELVNKSRITIDTVERYQGGARDIILISFCANTKSQLKTMTSISHTGVDRKLNVALTRAREQIILIGNHEIMSSNEIYKRLIQKSYQWKINSYSKD